MKELRLFWTITTDSNGLSVASTMGMTNQEGTGPFSICVSDDRVEELRADGDGIADNRELSR